jgi:hypothetical protein
METRQELEERLESLLAEIANEVQLRQGQSFDGELEDAILLLKEVKVVLKQLNDDKYEEEEGEVDEDESDTKLRKRTNDDDDDMMWGDDYEDGY